jgi:hypothetical protein
MAYIRMHAKRAEETIGNMTSASKGPFCSDKAISRRSDGALLEVTGNTNTP